MESVIKLETVIRSRTRYSTSPDDSGSATFNIIKLDSGFMLMYIDAVAFLNVNTVYEFPIPFVSAPFCICGNQQDNTRTFCSITTTTATSFWVKAQDVFNYGAEGEATVIAIGRWK